MLKFVINSPTKIQNFKQKTKHFAFFFIGLKHFFAIIHHLPPICHHPANPHKQIAIG